MVMVMVIIIIALVVVRKPFTGLPQAPSAAPWAAL